MAISGNKHSLIHFFLDCDTVGFSGLCRAGLEDALADSEGSCGEFLKALQSDCVANERVANEEQATLAKAVLEKKCNETCGKGIFLKPCQLLSINL